MSLTKMNNMKASATMRKYLHILLVSTLFYGLPACADFLSVTKANGFDNWGWANISYVPVDHPDLPSSIIFSTEVYYNYHNNWNKDAAPPAFQSGYQQAFRYHSTDAATPFAEDANPKYKTITLMIYVSTFTIELILIFLANNSSPTWQPLNEAVSRTKVQMFTGWVNPDTSNTLPLTDFNGMANLTLNQWNNITLDLASWYVVAGNTVITDVLIWDPFADVSRLAYHGSCKIVTNSDNGIAIRP